MKGYVVGSGYMGYIPQDGMYHLYATESDYIEDYEEHEQLKGEL
jgi:hypothetical protein